MNVMVNEAKPLVWIKWKCKDPSNVPLPRAGHTMTLWKQRFYLFGGIMNGLSDPAVKKISPTNEVWIMDAFNKNIFGWSKPANVNGDVPPPRSNHTATTIKVNGKDESIFVFGGVGENGKFNDSYIWTPLPDCAFTKIEYKEDDVVPCPRASHSACFYEGKVYIFGGNGGSGYENSVFKDLWAFDVANKKWEQINYEEKNPSIPELRTGHTMFIFKKHLYVYGGWNTCTAHQTAIKYSFSKNYWEGADMSLEDGFYVWNHCGLAVESGPGWKYFSFGGSSKAFDETKARERAECTNKITVTYLDEGEKMREVELEDVKVLPEPREDATMVYAQQFKNLLIFGGWNNEWYGDLYGICVSQIVGPSYSVKSLVPDKGRISGGQRIILKGSKLASGNITVFFILGNKEKHVSGECESDTEIAFITPSFIDVGPKDLEVRIKIDQEELSTNPVKFSIYEDTKPEKTIFFGPAMLDGCTPEVPVCLYIRARNEHNENRLSGLDKFKVIAVHNEDISINAEAEIEDFNNGVYKATFTVPKEGIYKINVFLLEEKTAGGDVTKTDIRGSPITVNFNGTDKANNDFVGNYMLTKFLKDNVDELNSEMKKLHEGIDPNGKDINNDINDIINIKNTIKEVDKMADNFDLRITQCMEYYEVANLDSKKSSAKGDITLGTIKKLGDNLEQLKKLKENTSQTINPIISKKTNEYQEEIKQFYSKVNNFGASIKQEEYAKDYYLGYQKATEQLEKTKVEYEGLKEELEEYNRIMENLNYPDETAGCKKSLNNSGNEIELIDKMWNFIKETQELLESFKAKTWPEIDGPQMDETISTGLTKKNNQMRKELSGYALVMNELSKEINKWKKLVPLVSCLKSDSMKDRHWDEFRKELNCPELVIDDKLKLQTFYDMEIHTKTEEITEITDKAVSEDKMGKKLDEIQKNWDKYEFELTDYARVPGVKELKFLEDPFADLEDNIQQIQSMIRNKYKAFYEEKIMQWKSDLAEINDVWVALNKTQVKWKFLESLFIGSDEIKKELPNETEDFAKINVDVKEILRVGAETKNILQFSVMKFDNPETGEERSLLEWLNNILERLEVCEKALNLFMDSKRLDFPRFYFMSAPDLLDVLSNGDSPTSINKHISKIIISMDHIEMEDMGKGERPCAKAMVTRTGIERIEYSDKFQLHGKVERYLHDILKQMWKTIKDLVRKSITQDINNLSQMEWIQKTCSQACLLCDLMKFVGQCETGIKTGTMKKVQEDELKSLNSLIKSILDEMTEETMAKVMVLIKSETHGRDVIEKIIDARLTTVDDFVWQSQMKAYWDKDKDDCHLNVCDAELWYGYEYLGNGDRLVVTPLTDRIYVTATQALHLKMGCSPAGPAGTGKTETTKDLSSAMGKACYVFNCSEQMDFQTMGDIFRGLAASGSWGCFDEFNRLIPEVLSVCSMQFKCVTDGLKKGQSSFIMDEKECALDPTCGVFITMNPGYLGRSELPEGLKALFRPITVVVPDYELIAENCLMAQGFEDAKMLAKKFVVLYALCKDLLSQQAHYDWGLRAIKSVLVVAGAFKRADRDMSELQLLKRALRDFNYPKIVADDLAVFNGLIEDLFPKIEVARKVDMAFEDKVKEACLVVNEKKVGKGAIQDDDAPPPFRLTQNADFILKCVQLKELIEIRHSVFVMGNAGSGKTSCWRTLAKAFCLYGKPTFIKDLNPKSIVADDLYGKYINMQTRDFKMGILSKAMKDFSSEPDKNQKWIILDGDLDAHWIENMNSVMDDNKVLTLPNNDRIDLLPHMRLFFEIRDLKYASPATVSRAGILYIPDDSGYQWKVYCQSWVKQMCFRPKVEKDTNDFFGVFLEPCINYLKKEAKFTIDKVFSITFAVGFCKLLEAYIDKKDACIPKNKRKQTRADDEAYPGYDLLFCFCAIWSMGAILSDKDGEDYRRKFSDWFRTTFKQCRIPNKGTVFDYYVVMDPEKQEGCKFEEWTKKISEIEYNPSENIRYVTVPTSETVSVSEIMEKLLAIGHPTLLIGMAGCGKTQIARGMLESARIKGKGVNFAYVTVNFNYYSDTYVVQSVLKENTQKKFGSTFGPKNDPKLMAIFVDDLNMQQLDRCDTQNAIELIRQFMDYKHIYECAKMELMEFVQIQFIAAMNPSAGSFSVNPRLQRHFWICSIPFPSDDNIRTIFQFFLTHHFERFHQSIQEISKGLIAGIVKLHKTVFSTFRKSAINFHYEFNIRHITGVFQGVLMSTVEKFQDAEKIAKLWVHECERVYGDRLVTPEDLSTFKKELGGEIVKTAFGGKYNLGKYLSDKGESIIFCRFVNGYLDNVYDMAKELQEVRDKANLALSDYNDQYTRMDLVLFEDAVKHVCRITRIITQPSGHACLVGVGGSGKQSLSKLSSFICQYNVYMITISSDYRMNNFKEDLQKMMNSTGGSDDYGLLFILTEGQIIDEKFMVLVNDLLSSGDVQDLFNQDDHDAIINKCKQACKSQTGKELPEEVWAFFISRVKRNLHIALCFSPGDNLRNKARKFPSTINNTVIDWFQPWPEEALRRVADEQLQRDFEDLVKEDYFQSVVNFMPASFKIVGEVSKDMFNADRRYTYITPKSFLELLKLFNNMYKKKVSVIMENKQKLEQGLARIAEAKEKIAKLEVDLEIKSKEIEVIKVDSEAKAKVANEKAEVVGKENDEAKAKEAVVSKDKAIIEEQSKRCQEELAKFKPLMIACQEAATKINKEDIDKVRTAKPSPPQKIMDLVSAIRVMVAGQIDEWIKIPVDKNCLPKGNDKGDILKILQDPGLLKTAFTGFLGIIQNFKYKEKNFDNVEKLFPQLVVEPKEEVDRDNKAEELKKVFGGVGELFKWLWNMDHYYHAAKIVEPLQKDVDEKTANLKIKLDELAEVQAKVAELEKELKVVMDAKNEAETNLKNAVDEETRCKNQLNLARRFTNALGSSSERWTINIEEYTNNLNVIIGDIVIASAFVSYVGPFPKKYREKIMTQFGNFITENGIPKSETALDPLKILTNDAEIARWNNQKLPADPVSVQNASILSNSDRWSLMIDPQLQGIKWIKDRETKENENGTLIIRMNDKKLIQKIGEAIEDGKSVILENLGEMIDATLSPIIGRNIYKKKYYKLGNNQHEINPKFKFIMHTKLSNPHYPPEIQAEACLINFSVTEDGLADQLLSIIVKMERPKLAAKKEEVIKLQNEYKIKLADLENQILNDLNQKGNLLENEPLVDKLENSSKVSEEVKIKIEESKQTAKDILESSNTYLPAAQRGSLIFFLLTELYKLHTFYKFSLESFVFVIRRAVKSVATKWEALLRPKEEEPDEDEEGEEKKEEAPAQPPKEEPKEEKKEEPQPTEEKKEEAPKEDADYELGDEKKEEKKEGEEGEKKEGEGEEEKKEGEGEEGEEAEEQKEEEIRRPEPEEEEPEVEVIEEMDEKDRLKRVKDLTEAITEFAFFYVRRGLFENHKLIFATLLTFRILLKAGKIDPEELTFLVEPKKGDPGEVSQSVKDLLKDYQITNVRGLEQLPRVFCGLLDQIGSNNEIMYWRTWLKDEQAENADLPKSQSKLTDFQRLLIIKALRPDRITSAITNYIISKMTDKYIESTTFDMAATYAETSSLTPIFFVLFPGVDPTKDVEELGASLGKTIANGQIVNIPMGQGQEPKANAQLKICGKEGKWIMLQNVHLMSRWIKEFENLLESVSQTAHKNFRCFISSEPPPLPTMDIIPEPILQASIKVSNEAPQDLKANMKRAWGHFNEERLNSCTKQNEFKAILFGLCFFHSLIIGRKKFGAIGWSRSYNFNEGDLQICADVLNNYLEKYDQVPYADLRYIYGEIMYGGHITDNWDRRTNNSYLTTLIQPGLLTGGNLAKNFKSPDPSKTNYEGYSKYINDKLPTESPNLFYLHLNAEISYLTAQGAYLFESILSIQGGSTAAGASAQKGDIVTESIKKFLGELKERTRFEIKAIRQKAVTPYDIVAAQECERLNDIFFTCINSLEELEKGLKGELNITEQMEDLSKSLRYNKVPELWSNTARYPSKKPLNSWFTDLLDRHTQLSNWVADLKCPLCLNLSLLCNPMSFVTAVKQFTARDKILALDHLDTLTKVMNFTADLVKEAPAEGVYVTGLFLQGAKWEDSNPDAEGFLTEMNNKELDPPIPVMQIYVVGIEEKDAKTVGFYHCPVYYTTARGGTYIFTAYLRMETEETDPNIWVMAGVALILSTDE